MPKNSCIMQKWAEPAKSALPICNYSQILYRFLTFTQNLKRSPKEDVPTPPNTVSYHPETLLSGKQTPCRCFPDSYPPQTCEGYQPRRLLRMLRRMSISPVPGLSCWIFPELIARICGTLSVPFPRNHKPQVWQ